jgi:hypothetical protein
MLVAGCHPNTPEKSSKMPEKIEITVNQSGKELQQRYPDQIKLVNRPPGVNFYSIDWPRESLGSVQLNAGPRPLTIDAALGLSGSDDPNFPAENILEWHIYAGLGNEEEIAQDDARQRFFAILQKIRNAGWQRYIGRGHPRLKGVDALRDAQRSAVYAQDPDYRPTLEQWMAMDDRSLWRFHADQAYMTVALTRDAARKEINGRGAYFIEFTVTDANEEARKIVGPAQRANWKTALPEELKLLKQDREKSEGELKKQGVAIDEGYQDPPIQ